MPTLQAEPYQAESVQSLLHQRGAEHLRARKYGATIIVESGPTGEPNKHLRFKRDTHHLWRVEIAHHSGRWQQTPFRATINELVELVCENFPWLIQDFSR